MAFLLFPPSASRNYKWNNFKAREVPFFFFKESELPTCALVSKTFGTVQINFILVKGVNITPVIKSRCLCVLCAVVKFNYVQRTKQNFAHARSLMQWGTWVLSIRRRLRFVCFFKVSMEHDWPCGCGFAVGMVVSLVVDLK